MIFSVPLMLAGLIAAIGVLLLVREWIPTQPKLGDAVTRLSPDTLTLSAWAPTTAATTRSQRIGSALQRRLIAVPRLGPSPADMDLLGLNPSTVYARKLGYALAGVTVPVVAGLAMPLLGVGLNLQIPAAVGLILGILCWFLEDSRIKEQAQEKRAEFVRACVAYLQLVAIHRSSGAGATHAMTEAAALSQTWTFRRIHAELGRAQWAHVPAWDAISNLGMNIGVVQLADIGDIMRLAGDGSSEIVSTLLARADGLRDQLLSEKHTRDNATTVSMTLPRTMLVVILLASLFYPLSIVLLE